MKVIALVTYKYDEDYVRDLKINLKGLADEVITKFDQHGDFWKEEGKYRENMVRQAEDKGADYVIVIDPDERFERAAIKTLKKLMKARLGERVMFELNYRELYKPNAYRIDGIWGKKCRVMAFSVFKDNIYSDAKLHSPREPLNKNFERIKTGLNVYHLKHIKPELRANRREIYNTLDPDKKYNSTGYDYLDDESNMQLKSVSLLRRYSPKYRDYTIDREMFDFANKKLKESKK